MTTIARRIDWERSISYVGIEGIIDISKVDVIIGMNGRDSENLNIHLYALKIIPPAETFC